METTALCFIEAWLETGGSEVQCSSAVPENTSHVETHSPHHARYPEAHQGWNNLNSSGTFLVHNFLLGVIFFCFFTFFVVLHAFLNWSWSACATTLSLRLCGAS